MKHRTLLKKVWPKYRRSDGVLLRNPAITANCSKEHTKEQKRPPEMKLSMNPDQGPEIIHVQMKRRTFATLESTLM